MKVTIKDIAERAGVHRSTVDKVIHNRTGVSDEVRARIQEIIKEMNYQPNPAGRLLQKQGRTYHIAAILVDVDAMPYIKAGIEDGVAAQTGFDIRIHWKTCKFSEPDRQTALIREAITEEVDAIIILPINAKSVRAALQTAIAEDILVVQTNAFLKGMENCCFVSIDSARCSRIAAHLMGEFLRGEGNVAIISSANDEENNNADVAIRESGFTDYIEQIYPAINIVECVESFEDSQTTYVKTLELLARHKDLNGIYITCGCASMVGQILKDCDRWQDIKVFSFEDYPEVLQLLKEGVIDCSISGDLHRQGSWPIEIIMDYLVFDKKPEQTAYYTESRILIKESVF